MFTGVAFIKALTSFSMPSFVTLNIRAHASFRLRESLVRCQVLYFGITKEDDERNFFRGEI